MGFFRVLVFLALIQACRPQSAEQQLNDLLAQSRQGSLRRWAELLIQADPLAERLARAELTENLRLLSMQGFTLTYRWSGLSGKEEYQHDLLRVVIHTQEGTKWGADALVALFTRRGFPVELANSEEWVEPYRVVIDLLESRRWRALKDPRLDRLLGEAYETWWSLSKANADDPNLADRGLSPADFADGADAARRSAIAAYERILGVAPNDEELRRRVADMRG